MWFSGDDKQVADGETEVLVRQCTPQNGRCIEELGSDHEKRSLPIHGTSHSSVLQSSSKVLHGLPKKVLACLAGSEARSRPRICWEQLRGFGFQNSEPAIHHDLVSWQAGDTTTFLLGRETC